MMHETWYGIGLGHMRMQTFFRTLQFKLAESHVSPEIMTQQILAGIILVGSILGDFYREVNGARSACSHTAAESRGARYRRIAADCFLYVFFCRMPLWRTMKAGPVQARRQ